MKAADFLDVLPSTRHNRVGNERKHGRMCAKENNKLPSHSGGGDRADSDVDDERPLGHEPFRLPENGRTLKLIA